MGIDIVFAILMVIAIYKGYSRGLIVAVFSFIAVTLGLAVALKLSTVTALYAQEHWGMHTRWLPVLSFIALFVGVVFAVRFGATLIQKMVEAAMLGWLNKLGGIILYSAIFIIVYSILLWIANQLYWLSPELKMQSVVYPYIEHLGPVMMNLWGKIVPVFKDMFENLQSFFDNAAKEIQST
ncbi:CvpA family protein [Chitinophaga filiformis]|uniref:Membrane protein required for colicin V production n=1 Tax=Chitinophaga filiformis TaxID=104663 RepID=A0A1G7UGP9_CHIFI|nr:CvpA family protein [Chitinophaga filiformis]SDG46722.1 membrane protein required for colicin V production [Chitinophaga filiformis]